MTETQATPGAAGASTAPAGSEGTDAPDGAGAGQAVVGRAHAGSDTPPPPKFTRAPGMAPPPDSTEALQAPSGAQPLVVAPAPLPVPPEVAAPANVTSTGRAAVPGAARVPLGATGRTTPLESQTAPISAPGARGRAVPASGKMAEAVRSARAAVSGAASRGPRRARLFVKRIDPWSVMKFSFAVSFVLFFVAIVATAVIFLAMDEKIVFYCINKTQAELRVTTGGVNKHY